VEDPAVSASDPQNLTNIKAEKGNSSGEVRQNFTVNLLHDVPLGEGHRFLKGAVRKQVLDVAV
jgi:hypothetical protein